MPLIYLAANSFQFDTHSAVAAAIFSANLSTMSLDYIARVKVGGTHLTYGYVKQFPIIGPSSYSSVEMDFIVPRALELTFTAHDLEPFYADVVSVNFAWDNRTGSERSKPWRWNPERRALLRAELDAIYARLYGMSRDDLRYILDPEDIMGKGYPSQTFRGLRDKEVRHLGEYRTRRLVLEAWDRMEAGELV